MALVMFKCFDCEFISNSMQDVKNHIQMEHEQEDNNSESNSEPIPLVEISDNRNSDQDSSNVVTARVLQTGMKWAHQMVLYLIECYKKHQNKFQAAGYHGKQVWNLISKDFSKKYGEMSGESCNEKWRNLKKTYIRIKRNLDAYGTTHMKFLYFDEMDSIYSKDPEIHRPFSHKKRSENETNISKVPKIKEVIPSPTKVLIPVIKKINSSPSEIQFFHLPSSTILTSVNQKQQETPKESPKQTLPHCCSLILAEIKKLEEAREVAAEKRHREKMALKRELINIKKQKLLLLEKLEE